MYSINQDPSAFVLNLNQTNTYASGTNGFAKDQVNTMGNNRYLEFVSLLFINRWIAFGFR